MKFINFLLFLILLQSCSLNNDSVYWKEHNKQKILDQKRMSKIIEKSNNIISMSLDEYKIYIEDHTKKSRYPDISQ